MIEFEYVIGQGAVDLLEWLERWRKKDYLFILNDAIGFAYVRPLVCIWIVDVGHIAVGTWKRFSAAENELIEKIVQGIYYTVIHEVIHTCYVSHDRSTVDVQDIDGVYRVSIDSFDIVTDLLSTA